MFASRDEFKRAYQLLLIKQYFEKPKAKAEIAALVDGWYNINRVIDEFVDRFDVDSAVGDQQDIIGKIIGFSRHVPFVVPLPFFGFADNPDAFSFASKFDPAYEGAPLASKFQPTAASLQLGDSEYRRYLKAKINKNVGIPVATLGDYDKVTAQDAVQQVFNGNAYIVDNQDMTATIFYESTVDENAVNIIDRLDLLPRPAAVRYIFEEIV